MKRAIVTGFEPFGPYKYNPTQDLAKELDGKVIQDTQIKGLVLPSTYIGSYISLALEMAQYKPNIILSVGLSSSVQGIRLESVGRNRMDGKYPDALGNNPKGKPILKLDRPEYFTNVDNSHLASNLSNEGIAAHVSTSADFFVCNSLIYLTAGKIEREKLPIKFAFFHIPWTEDYLDKIHLEQGKVTIKKQDLVKTIEVLLREL